MAVGAFTHRPLPLPLRWQREETQGHDGGSVVGLIDTVQIDNEAGHVWGEGELFDDISPATNPKLAEDVGEAKFLLKKGTIGPSVDPGHASAMAVVKGTDQPMDDRKMFEMLATGGKPPQMETLFTAYEIAGATLVPVPAFAECRPFELLEGQAALAASERDDTARAALLAAALLEIDPALFSDPGLDRITPITRRDLGNGLVHVFGHIAEHLTCLVGRRDMCITPPYSASEYSSFHRYHETVDGSITFPLPVGRLTAGFGSLENTCRCCPGNDDHACANLSFGAAIAHHDRMEVLAYVRAGEDDNNNAIWISGIEAPGISEQGVGLLGRQKVSGDWRYSRGDMELTEVLVLNRRSPGFPLPRTTTTGGRQHALTAAGAIMSPLDRQELLAGLELPLEPDAASSTPDIDYERLGQSVAAALVAAAEGEQDDAHDLFGFNKNQKRGPDGKWIRMGGPGSAGGRASLPGRREGVSRPREGGGAGAGGGVDNPGDSQTPTRSRLTDQEQADLAELRAGTQRRRDSGEMTPYSADTLDQSADGIERDLASDKPSEVQRGRANLERILTARRKQEGAPVARQRKPKRDKFNEQVLGLAREALADEENEDDEELDVMIVDLQDALDDGDPEANAIADRLRDYIASLWAVRDRVPPALTAAAGHTGAMVALVPTAEHAARLAVTDGEPIEDLHMTVAYLGEAADVPEGARERIHQHAAQVAAGLGGPIEVNASDLTYFNPGNTNGFDTALVLGLSGEGLTEMHDEFRKLDLDGWEMPQQHVPYKPHVTLQYTNDMKRAAALTDRVGPVQFDRLRLAYGGEVTDIPLGAPPGGPLTEVGGGYDIAGQESMMSNDLDLRARAAQAALALAGVGEFCGGNGHMPDFEDDEDNEDEFDEDED